MNTRQPIPRNDVLCPYCGGKAVFHENGQHRSGIERYGPVYQCPNMPCDAYVGAHPQSFEPFGTLANRALRDLRGRTHELFEPLYSYDQLAEAFPTLTLTPDAKAAACARAYAWLAAHIGMTASECDIARFREADCRNALMSLAQERPTARSILQWSQQPRRPH